MTLFGVMVSLSVFFINLSANQKLIVQEQQNMKSDKISWTAEDRREKNEYRERQGRDIQTMREYIDSKTSVLRDDFSQRLVTVERDLEEPRFGENYYKNAYHQPIINAVNNNADNVKNNSESISELKDLINDVGQDTRFIRMTLGKETIE